MGVKVKNFIFIAVSVLLAVILLCSENVSVLLHKISGDYSQADRIEQIVTLNGAGKGGSYTKVIADGTSELYYCDENGSVVFHDIMSDQQYYSNIHDNPVFKGMVSQRLTDEVVLCYSLGDSVYSIGSNDQSVTHETVIDDNDLMVKYTFLFDENNRLNINVNYTIEKNTLYVKAEYSDILLSDCKILSVRLLSGMGCALNGSDNFYLLPDESGALLNLDEKFGDSDVVTQIYGSDITLDCFNKSENIKSGFLPIFGVKNGDQGFIAIIEEGDAVCSVNASRTSGNEVCYIYPEFAVTPSFKREDNTIYAADTGIYNGVKIAYRFMSKTLNNYEGMAISCYEQFIRNGTLSISDNTSFDGSVPLILNIYGKKLDQGGKVLSTTNYAQTQAMLEDLYANGVYDICVRYKNALNGYEPDRDLGGSRKFKELCDFCNSKGIRLYFEVDPFSIETGNRYDVADSIFGRELSRGKGAYLRSADSIGDYFYSMLNDSTDYLDYLSLSNVGSMLYGDYRPAGVIGRQDMKNHIFDMLSKLGVSHKYMISGGNAYTLRKADVVTDITMAEEADGYQPVCFAQMVLHGNIIPAGAEVSGGNQLYRNIYKELSYGSLPVFTVSYSMNDYAEGAIPNENTTDYMAWKKIIIDFYSKTYSAYSELSDKRLLYWNEISSGVYTADFEDDLSLVVNSTDEEVGSGGSVVKAHSFLLTDKSETY